MLHVISVSAGCKIVGASFRRTSHQSTFLFLVCLICNGAMRCSQPILSNTNSPVDVAVHNSVAFGRPSRDVAELIDSCKKSMLCSMPFVSLAYSPLEVAVQTSIVSMRSMSDAECPDPGLGSGDLSHSNLGVIKVFDICENFEFLQKYLKNNKKV